MTQPLRSGSHGLSTAAVLRHAVPRICDMCPAIAEWGLRWFVPTFAPGAGFKVERVDAKFLSSDGATAVANALRLCDACARAAKAHPSVEAARGGLVLLFPGALPEEAVLSLVPLALRN